jgi:hypothetical protein
MDKGNYILIFFGAALLVTAVSISGRTPEILMVAS